MHILDFDFELPENLIAREPSPRREDARLLVYDRTTRIKGHRRVGDLLDFLRPGDALVLNETRVVPARIEMRRATGGLCEGLVLRDDGREIELVADGGGRLREGEILTLDGGSSFAVELLQKIGDRWRARVRGWNEHWLDQVGRVPIPPYIRKARKHFPSSAGDLESLDRERYQTVFANKGSAVAAPTAGLHFTKNLLVQIEERGVRIIKIQLDVGPGTFAPIRVDHIELHKIAPELYHISEEAAEAINLTKSRGGRIVAVGTTVVRALEFVANARGEVRAGSGATDMFIRPGYSFKIVGALMTNFHLPKSTLLMLVCAFAGTDEVLELYREAVRENYRFYSYGDATLFI